MMYTQIKKNKTVAINPPVISNLTCSVKNSVSHKPGQWGSMRNSFGAQGWVSSWTFWCWAEFTRMISLSNTMTPLVPNICIITIYHPFNPGFSGLILINSLNGFRKPLWRGWGTPKTRTTCDNLWRLLKMGDAKILDDWSNGLDDLGYPHFWETSDYCGKMMRHRSWGSTTASYIL